MSKLVSDPRKELAVLAEGNISVRTQGSRFLIKSSGSSLADASEKTLVEIDQNQVLELLDEAQNDSDVAHGFKEAVRWGTGRPSVETILHAACLALDGINAVIHTHPVSVNALLCSNQAEEIVAGALFPDQIVVLGTSPLFIPYADPGLTLAKLVKEKIEGHRAETGAAPKVIYLQNHGLFALGSNLEEALAVTTMADKHARILSSILQFGTPRYLSKEDAIRIDTRPDEIHRRELLAVDRP